MPSSTSFIGKMLLMAVFTALIGGCFGRSTKIMAPTALSYPTAEWVVTVGEPVIIPAPLIEGDAPDLWVVTPELPLGLTLDSKSGIISGTPGESCPSAFFTITASNYGGEVSVGLEIRVLPEAPCDLAYSLDSVQILAFSSFPTLTPTLGCGPSSDYSVDPALPEGVVLDPHSGVLSGMPIVSQDATLHQLTAANESGSASFSILIEIIPAGPCDLAYLEDDKVVAPFAPMDPISPTTGCGEADLWLIDPALPEGISIDPTTGIISGTPALETPRIVYSVIASNEHGSDETEIALRISPVFTYQLEQISGEYDQTTGEGGAEVRIILTEGGDNVTFPTQILMLSLALAHDVERLDLTSVVPGQDLTGFNDGNGPEFFAPFETPDGFTLGIVFSFSADAGGLTADLPREVAVVTYSTIPDAFSGNSAGDQSDLDWGNPSAGAPGIPSVGNTVVLDGVTGILPITDGARLDLVPSE